MQYVHSLVEAGTVARLGLSNYSALETQRCAELCKERGWTAPTVYQGLYNPLNRLVEEELIRRALKQTGGNRTRASQLLEISHRALLYKLKEYGITD